MTTVPDGADATSTPEKTSFRMRRKGVIDAA
jgi:hypothetical protein